MSEIYYFYDYVDEHDRHEVHRENCISLPKKENRTYIGIFDNCKDAIRKAERIFVSKDFDGCKICSRECHDG